MGLLDSLTGGSRGGYGGLLDMLMYPSPLQKPEEVQQPQYDPMGNYTGITPQATSPFGQVPQANMPTPAQFQPASVFNGGVSAPPVAGLPPQGAAPQPAAQPMPQQPTDAPLRSMAVGGYQMPQYGAAQDYAPQNPQMAASQAPTDISAQSRTAEPQALPPAFGVNSSALGRMFNPDGLIARLTGNDSRSMAQQNLKAQYDSLVPLVGPQKAMLAVMNPEAGKTILAQALEKKQYGFQKMDADTIVRTDPLTGKAELAYGGGEDSRSITGPDGKQIAIPPGVDRKTFVNEVSRANAKAAAGEKTEVQAKAEIFANKMEMSNKSISDDVGGSLAGKIASGVPLGNYVQSPEYQKYKQASSNFITALLRQESGAAISKSEFERYDKEYMPQPGDGKEVLAQKAQARQVAIEGMKKGAGPGYKSPTELGPSAGAVQMGYRFKGGNPADRGSWEKVQ